jgi:hypothetical protein
MEARLYDDEHPEVSAGDGEMYRSQGPKLHNNDVRSVKKPC